MLLQVASVLSLIAGVPASVPVRNAGDAPTRVTVELYHGTIDTTTGQLDLGPPAIALISPAAFPLAPGEVQTIRLLLKERCKAGTVLRLVTTFTPVAPRDSTATDAIITQVTYVTRFITKAVVTQ